MKIKTPRVFLPLIDPRRYKGIYGGRGSGKSHFFAEALVEKCVLEPGTHAVCLREKQRTLDQSVKRLIELKVEQFGVGHLFDCQRLATITPGGGRIIYEGMQNHTADSIKSLESYDVALFEEAQTASQRSITLLYPTLRKSTSEIWFAWNPEREDAPIERFFHQRLAGDPDAIAIKANYDTNPWFPDVLRAEMERDRRRDPEKYRWVWLGEYLRNSEARVFHNWTVDAAPSPPDGTRYYFGADWGFSIDPTVLIRAWFPDGPRGRTLVIDREAYHVGCRIEDTPALFDTVEDGQARKWPITADSARPETIDYVNRHGYPRVKPAKKGQDSVKDGIEFLKNYDILVDERCRHTIDELQSYRFKTDPLTGDVLPVLEDKKNHVIDALRYAVEGVRRSNYDLSALT